MPLRRVLRSLSARLRPDRRWLAWRYLRGQGLEIGALHDPLKLPPWARVRYVDRMPVPELRRQYPELARLDLVDVDIIADGETLTPVADASVDFVVANHFIEHCEDPLRAFANMLRVLRPGGILYAAVPDKRFTFDVDRPSTSIAHLVRDHEEGPAVSRRAHFEEWVAHVDKQTGAAAAATTQRLMDTSYSIHFHVWTASEFFELVVWLRTRETFELECALRSGDETIFVLRR
jgi:SAM-dependent methyltransferase